MSEPNLNLLQGANLAVNYFKPGQKTFKGIFGSLLDDSITSLIQKGMDDKLIHAYGKEAVDDGNGFGGQKLNLDLVFGIGNKKAGTKGGFEGAHVYYGVPNSKITVKSMQLGSDPYTERYQNFDDSFGETESYTWKYMNPWNKGKFVLKALDAQNNMRKNPNFNTKKQEPIKQGVNIRKFLLHKNFEDLAEEAKNFAYDKEETARKLFDNPSTWN